MDPQSVDKQKKAAGYGKCQVCSVPASKLCTACLGVFYCSPEHQSLDWKTHKANCKAYVLRKNDVVGRHWISTRNLKAQEIVLEEAALSCAPAVFPSHFDEKCTVDTRFCYGCLRYLSKGTGQKCSKCRMPVCSSTCEKIPLHSGNECEILKGICGRKGSLINHIPFDDLFILRTCLLKKKNPPVWKSLMTLEHSRDDFGERSRISIATILFIQAINRFTTINLEDWKRVTGILKINTTRGSIDCKHSDGSQYKSSWQYVCLDGSLFAHSCVPNCTIDCKSPPPNVELVVRTVMPVKKGEMLTIDYEGNKWFMATYMRRREIFGGYLECNCIRCQDPTELGSNLSTFICGSCKSPQMLPTMPYVETAEWKCKSCGVTEEGESKIALMDNLHEIVEKMKPEKEGPKKLREFIATYSGTILHPNNWVLVHALIKYTDYHNSVTSTGSYGYEDKEENQSYLSSCEQLVQITNLVAPGINLQRAKAIDKLGTCLMRKTMNELSFTPMPVEEFRMQLDRVKKYYNESYKFFKTFRDYYQDRTSSNACETERELKNVEHYYNNPPRGTSITAYGILDM